LQQGQFVTDLCISYMEHARFEKEKNSNPLLKLSVIDFAIDAQVRERPLLVPVES
jgi:hypothetical protein